MLLQRCRKNAANSKRQMATYSGQENIHQNGRNALAARHQWCQQARRGGGKDHGDCRGAGYERAGELQPSLCQDAQIADRSRQCNSGCCLQHLCQAKTSLVLRRQQPGLRRTVDVQVFQPS